MIPAPATRQSRPAGWQVFVDLVIALALVLLWLIPDAKRSGRSPWPWVALTLTLGSFGPLLYLVFAGSAEQKQVALAGRDSVEEATAAAAAAYPAWRDNPPVQRARIMFRLKQLLEDNAGHICALITAEHGKVLDDAMGEFQRGIENIEYVCGIPELLKGEHSRNVGPAIDTWSEFQPLGVVTGITPFNFPAMVPLWMWPMAIACGNTFFTRDGEAARYFADHIEVGMVGINVPLPVPVAYHSFGGWKRSLFGDLHAYGPDSMRFYTKRKTITQRWPSSGVREGAQFTFPSNG